MTRTSATASLRRSETASSTGPRSSAPSATTWSPRRAPSSVRPRFRPRARGRARLRPTRSRDPGREPVRLEDDDVVVPLAAVQLARNDLVQLMHLEPVEDAALDRLDQVAGLDLRLLLQVAADESRALEHDVVELAARPMVRARGADEGAWAEPLAAENRVGRCR